MAKISRVKQEIFGIDGPVGEFGQIGSDANGAANNTKDIATIQSLTQYKDGLFAVFPNADEPPIAEEINSMYYLFSTQIAQLMQAGIPEWETNTDYYVGSFVQVAGVIYVSIDGVDPTPNQGNNPTSSPAFWKLAFPREEVVYSQETFNATIERVAANQYKFRDDIISIRFLYLSGGYLMTGGTSPLSGGDTWGYIETNNSQNIIFDSGAFLHMGNERGYLEVNTDHCYLRNVNIIGTGTVASAIVQSFLLNADYATFINCKSSSRLSSGNYGVFQGSGTASHNDTSAYIHCSVFDIEIQAGTLNGGFRNCKNLIDCNVFDFTYSGAASGAVGFNTCVNLSNCNVSNLNGAGVFTYGYTSCNTLTDCIANLINSDLNNCVAFNTCVYITNCKATNITSSTGDVAGFNSCNNINVCEIDTITHNGGVASKNAYGLTTCNQISTCCVNNVTTNGAGGTANAYEECKRISSCEATNSDRGYFDCSEISSSYAGNNVFHGFSTCERINGCFSENNTQYGYTSCKHMTTNRSTGNVLGAYNNCFADFGGTQAVADTATGGYNG